MLYPAELLRQICIINFRRGSYYTLISIFFNSFIKKLIIILKCGLKNSGFQYREDGMKLEME
ncbi:hypothetical protein BK141_29375 [Paenibacillus sp. FSL R5-0765]|nr:hypothetical protein BK141_29375 [Paenibacillus sp. FSL R5-0765]